MVKGYRNGVPFEIDLWPIATGHSLNKPAAMAFRKMDDAAAADGHVIDVNESFRTWERQQQHWDRRKRYLEFLKELERYERGSRKDYPEPIKFAARAARPGHSTHQSGDSVDINRAQGDDPKTRAYDSPMDLWLQHNAARFGFVNDVKDEPWHYTFLPGLAYAALAAAGRANEWAISPIETYQQKAV